MPFTHAFLIACLGCLAHQGGVLENHRNAENASVNAALRLVDTRVFNVR